MSAKNIQQELREILKNCQGTTLNGIPEDRKMVEKALEAINSLVRECAGNTKGTLHCEDVNTAWCSGCKQIVQERQQFLNRWLEDGLTIKQRMENLENNLMERKSHEDTV